MLHLKEPLHMTAYATSMYYGLTYNLCAHVLCCIATELHQEEEKTLQHQQLRFQLSCERGGHEGNEHPCPGSDDT